MTLYEKHILVVGFVAFDFLRGGASGSKKEAGTDPVSPTTKEFKLSNSAPKVAYLNERYNFKPELEGDFEVEFVNKPDWISFDSQSKSITGIPTKSDLPEGQIKQFVSLIFKGKSKSISYEWFLNYVSETSQPYSYNAKRPSFTLDSMKNILSRAKAEDSAGNSSAYFSLLTELRNVLALKIHEIDFFNGNEVASDYHVTIYDSGVSKSDAVNGAVVYRADAGVLNIDDDSHGTSMARYMLRYAPGLRLSDINVEYPLDIAASLAIKK